MAKKPTDMTTYDDINNKLSQQQKESLMTASLENIKTTSHADSGRIYGSVDELEALIAGDGQNSGVHGRLDTVNANLALVISAIDSAKTAIVNAINNH